MVVELRRARRAAARAAMPPRPPPCAPRDRRPGSSCSRRAQAPRRSAASRPAARPSAARRSRLSSRPWRRAPPQAAPRPREAVRSFNQPSMEIPYPLAGKGRRGCGGGRDPPSAPCADLRFAQGCDLSALPHAREAWLHPALALVAPQRERYIRRALIGRFLPRLRAARQAVAALFSARSPAGPLDRMAASHGRLPACGANHRPTGGVDLLLATLARRPEISTIPR